MKPERAFRCPLWAEGLRRIVMPLALSMLVPTPSFAQALGLIGDAVFRSINRDGIQGAEEAESVA